MPFKSKAQQRYMFANMPKLAKKFADEMTAQQYKTLPSRVKKKKNNKGKR